MTSLALALVTAFALSLVATPLCRAAARRWGLLDRPNERSSHQEVVPRGGGTAIARRGARRARARAVGLGRPPGRRCRSCWAAWPWRSSGWPTIVPACPPSRASWPSSASWAWSCFGWAGSSACPCRRCWSTTSARWRAAATVLWIVAVVNFYNFLDGIDGLAALQAVVTGAGVLLAGWDPFAALLAAALVGAAAGFLPFNWSRASVFLGDIGSYFLGYTLAALPLLAPPQLRSQAAVVRGREPVAVPGRRDVDARRPCPSRRAPRTRRTASTSTRSWPSAGATRG